MASASLVWNPFTGTLDYVGTGGGSGAVTSVAGTVGQTTVNQTTGDVIFGLENGIWIGNDVTPPTGGVQTAGPVFVGGASSNASVYSNLNAGATFQSDVLGQVTPYSDNNFYSYLNTNFVQPESAGNTLASFADKPIWQVGGNAVAVAASFYAKPDWSLSLGTVALFAGFYQPVINCSYGTITSAYAAYLKAPTGAGINAGLYADNATLGYTNASPPSNGLIVSGIAGFGTNSPNSASQMNISSSQPIGLNISGSSPNLTSNQQFSLLINQTMTAANSVNSCALGIQNTFTRSAGLPIQQVVGIDVGVSFAGNTQTITNYYGLLVAGITASAITNAISGVFVKPSGASTINKALWSYDMTVGSGSKSAATPTDGLYVQGNILNNTLTASQVVASDGSKNLVSIASSSSGYVLTSNGPLAPTFQAPTTGVLPYSDQSTSFPASVNTGYFCNAGLTATMPTTTTTGTIVVIVALAASVVIQANTGQKIQVGIDTSGTAGTATNTEIGDVLYLVYQNSTSTWVSVSANGNWNVV